MCVIAQIRLDNNIYLAKNRDRYYITPIKLIRDKINNVEVVYLLDVKTGWIEGINEYGISLVNSVLPIAKEENMTDDGKYSGKSDGKFDGKYQGKITNKDGQIILNALSQTRIEDALSILINCKCYNTLGLNGHTIISNGKYSIGIEHLSDKVEPVIKIIDKNYIRTNHTVHINYKNGGYTPNTNFKGYKSSILRQRKLKKLLKTIKTKEDIVKNLTDINYKDPCNSIYRIGYRCDTNYKFGFATTTQLFIDVNSLTLNIYLDKFNSKFVGVKDNIGDSNNSKVKYNVQYINREFYPESTLKVLPPS